MGVTSPLAAREGNRARPKKGTKRRSDQTQPSRCGTLSASGVVSGWTNAQACAEDTAAYALTIMVRTDAINAGWSFIH